MRARRGRTPGGMRALYCGDWDVEPRVAEVRFARGDQVREGDQLIAFETVTQVKEA